MRKIPKINLSICLFVKNMLEDSGRILKICLASYIII